MEGLVLFNKPPGYTSRQIVNYFKNLTNNKVGHGGTLDPFASGLLILGIGEGTKELSKFLRGSTKTYIANIKLGYISDTYDREGKIFKVKSSIPDIKEIEKISKSFIGEIEQTPPHFSAIKIKGIPAYKLKRKGIEFEIRPRIVKIYDLKIIDFKPIIANNSFESAILKIECLVSSGTYIRSLANDLGNKLGCGGYLDELYRIKINEYDLENALSFEDLNNDNLEFLAKVYGRVQGVGYRYFVKNKAKELDILGYVKNLNDGTVEVLAQGREENLQKLVKELKKGPFLAKVEKVEVVFRKPINFFSEFKIQ